MAGRKGILLILLLPLGGCRTANFTRPIFSGGALRAQWRASKARRDQALAKLRYENGVTSNLEVLDSQRNQYSAEQGLAQLQSAALVARVNLTKALGGDWGAEPAPGPGPAPR